MKVLHVLSECYPLIKTGGLADYGYSLPHALKRHGADARLLMPGYGDVLNAVEHEQLVGEFEISMAGVTRADAQVVYNLTANYSYQDERSLRDDIRILAMLQGNRI